MHVVVDLLPSVATIEGLALTLERHEPRDQVQDGRDVRLTSAPATTADTVRVHVGSLRRKLEPDPATPRYIGTEPWVGYRFLAEPE